MAVKAINNSAGLDSIVSTLLVFGVYLRLTEIDLPFVLVTKKAKAFCVATKVRRLYTKKQIKNALVIRNNLDIKNILDLLL
jgi:hypothetical protein